MGGPRIIVAAAIALAGLAWTSGAVAYDIRDQQGIVTAIADGVTESATLPIDSDGSITVTVGSTEPGMDYATGSLLTDFQSDQLRVVASGDVGPWGNEGAVKVLLVLQFSVDQDTPYTLVDTVRKAKGSGWLGDRALILLSNEDGVILRRHPGGGFAPCEPDHPNADTLCQTANAVLPTGEYTLEVRVSSYAPGTCESCKGFATSADVDLTILFF